MQNFLYGVFVAAVAAAGFYAFYFVDMQALVLLGINQLIGALYNLEAALLS